MALHIGIITDFNSDNLGRIVQKQCSGLGETVLAAAPFGQVMQTLLRPFDEFWHQRHDAVIVWTSPGSVIPSFERVLEFEGWSADDLSRDVDAFANLLGQVAERAERVFLASWTVPAFRAHGAGIEAKHEMGATAAVWHMNARLAEALQRHGNIVLFNTERWLRQAGSGAWSDKLWYLSKTPFSAAVFERAAADMIATLNGMMGLRRKLVVVDLDNTLWGGIIGDIGAESIRLGGHDPVGEAFAAFQQELKRLSRQGIVLAVVSKNEEATALEVIDRHPEMVLRSRDFGGWRINWQDKAENIADLLDELNLGMDSAVFLDDSPHERARVRDALPGVLVPDWPSDPMEFAKALRELRCFESPSLTAEDRQRTAMYASERERQTLKTQVVSIEAWLDMLDIELAVQPLGSSNLERTAQLLNKTNQMNLRTRRLSTQELALWAAADNHQTWTFSVKDKLGDFGLCGIASFSLADERANLVDFVLSCRAMGRGVEDAIISVVASKAREAGMAALVASYVATAKNQPCIKWIERQPSFVRQSDGQTFVLDLNQTITAPKHVRIAFPFVL